MLGHQLVYTGKKLYLIGGYNADQGAATGQIFEAVMDPTGKITSWAGPISNAFPDNNYRTYNFMHAIVGDVLIVAGGRGPNLHDSRTSDKIFYSKISSDGSIGPWKESSLKLPKPLCCAGIAASGGSVYITGGHDGAVYFDNVWSTTIDNILGVSGITPTPTEVPASDKPYLVFVPGMFTSWNSDALVHGKEITNEDWIIPNSIDVYDSFLKNLYSVGYKKDQDLWVYNYDWRRNVLKNGQDLKQYILDKVLRDKPPGSKVALVGHSMGGLVSRAAVDDELSGKVSHLITLGTPHLGAAMVYPVWEGADFSEFTGLQAVLMRSYLRVNSVFFDNQVLAIHELVPSLQNLLPNWDFLKNKKGSLINTTAMVWKNNVAAELNFLNPVQTNFLYTFGGSGIKTLNGYYVDKDPRTNYGYGAWVDGKPFKKEYSLDGDNTVLLSSSLLGADNHKFEFSNTDHGEIVTKKDSQNKVLELLGLSAIDRIENSKYNKFFRSVVVIVGSPVTFTLTDPDGISHQSEDSLLLLDEPKSGQYRIDLEAVDDGNYTLYFGRLNGSDEAWDQTKGSVQYPGQKVSYSFKVNFQSSDLGADPLSNLRSRINLVLSLVKPFGLKNGKLAALSNQLRRAGALIDQLKIQALKPAKKVIAAQIDNELNSMVKFVGNNNFYLDDRIKEEIVEGLRLARMDLDQYLSDLGLSPN
jgi:pimeloyl-ACP methyl ester carboxylesterase